MLIIVSSLLLDLNWRRKWRFDEGKKLELIWGFLLTRWELYVNVRFHQKKTKLYLQYTIK